MQAETPRTQGADAGSAASLHQRILADIEQRILSGAWPPGHRIPSEHELTEHYGCSRMTVNKVLTQLARAGMIERRRKAGSFVTQSQSGSAILEIQEIKAEVQALGLPYRFELRERVKPSQPAWRSRAPRPRWGRSVLLLDCVHFADARPFASRSASSTSRRCLLPRNRPSTNTRPAAGSSATCRGRRPSIASAPMGPTRPSQPR